ncbi:MAG TPA: acyl carrier protein [Kofleriaceae bacterium]|nr:acyl carrier protein [Kofleriaceae bacterium]
MGQSGTIDIVRRFIAEVCAADPASIQPAGRLLAFGLDSVRLLDLLLAVEERFGLQISESDPDLAEVETVADLAALIDRRRASKGDGAS